MPLNHKSFALLTSIFSLSIVISYLIPPFSNLFLNINASEAAATHYRLMWSSEIFSPLPLFINGAVTFSYRNKLIKLMLVGFSTLIITLVLIPLPNLNKSSDSSQLLWSKTKQIFQAPSDQIDQSKIVKALLPKIYQQLKSGIRMTFLSDEMINFSLSPYSNYLQPLNPPRRISKVNELNNNYEINIKNPLSEDDQKEWLLSLKSQPDWIIQQKPIGAYYSPYAEIGAYDLNIADTISKQFINRLSARVLEESGYILIDSDNPTYKIWQKTI